MKKSSTWNYALNEKDVLDFNLLWSFQTTWTCFGNIITRTGKPISLACIFKHAYASIVEL